MLKSASTDNIGSEDPELDSVLVCVSLSEKLRFGFDPDVDALDVWGSNERPTVARKS